MHFSSESVEILVEQFSRLPTIGRKTARRLAAYVLKMSREDVEQLATALVNVKDRVIHCTTCFNITDVDPCPICDSGKRDTSVICVVEEPGDVAAIERTHGFKGVYHVLGGVISPLDGVGPEDLTIKQLIKRLQDQDVSEVILAVNPNVEGDTTAYYISQLLKPLGVQVSRLARGIPIGGDLEFADDATLSRALESRVSV